MGPVRLDPDRNISLDVLALGGAPFGAKHVRTQNEFHLRVVDGDPTTAFEEAEVRELLEHPFIGIDLGGILPVKRVVFYPTPEGQDRFVEDFKIYLFGGDPSLLFSPLGNVGNYDLVASVEDNRSPRVGGRDSDPARPHRNGRHRKSPHPAENHPPLGNRRARGLRGGIRADRLVLHADPRPGGSGESRRGPLGGEKGARSQPGDQKPQRLRRRSGPLLAGDRPRHRAQLPRRGGGRTLTREEYEGMLLTEQGRHQPRCRKLELLVGALRLRGRGGLRFPGPEPVRAVPGRIRELRFFRR